MASLTSNYGWTKPAVGADNDLWGSELNTDLDGIDSTVQSVSNVAAAALPKAGGTMTGPIVLAADPAAALQPATKQYVDSGRLGDNRIINGDMRIDQRNGGAIGTAVGYAIDRWQFNSSLATKGSWAGAGINYVGPTSQGFPSCLGFTSNSAYAVLAGDFFSFAQTVEADMISDFAFGSASAQSITLSFLAFSTLTGTFGGSIRNGTTDRSYVFTYSLPAASTWTKVIINIPGDTAGTWVMKGNARAMYVTFSFGAGTTFSTSPNAWTAGNFVSASGAVSVVGTNGAIFGLTGVKLEIGSIATPYNRQSMAKSLADCQRYFESAYADGVSPGTASVSAVISHYVTGLASVANSGGNGTIFKVTKRIQPTITMYSPVTGVAARVRDFVNNTDVTANIANTSTAGFTWNATASAASTIISFQGIWTASAEL